LAERYEEMSKGLIDKWADGIKFISRDNPNINHTKKK
jgi:hypothetical protein